MKEEQNKLIKELLNNKFDIEKFKEFTARVLNVKVANRKESEAVWEEFKEYIHSYQVISDYKDSEDKRIEIMVVKLNDERDPARAKVKQRNFIAKFLKEYHKEASLVAFYSDDTNIWKLSFVRLDYSFTFTGIEEKVTPSKRASYIVGEGEGNKTVIKQFSSLIGNENEVSLAQLENLFQLEKVTNEFFDEYRKKYLDLKEHLEKDQEFVKEALKHTEKVEDFSEEFAKKLMGQLAFLYFLQKKGWLGVKIIPQKLDEKDYLKIYSRASSTGKDLLDTAYRKISDTEYKLRSSLDEKFDYNSLANCFKNTDFDKEWGTGEQKFIRTLFERHKELNIKAEAKGRDKKNFFNDYLEPMFYEALNYNRGDNQYFPLFNCKIPFLNGGLFEALDNYDWKNTDFHIPDEIFSNSKEAFDGDGILDVFDRFNFTINENEPSETEVAVDPEMLGKVFENLLDVKDRKSKGAFYTPREIVHYMCKESLINYLSNEISEVEKKDFEQLLQMGEFTRDYDSRLFAEYKKGEKIGKDEWGLPRNLLKNVENVDKALANVKVADPAIGSGAFPLGMLTEIVKARSILTEYMLMHEFFRLEKEDKTNDFNELERQVRRKRSLYKLKLDTIENSLFGVDIEPSAVDIAKLRLWLSIVVDSPNDDIQPLPNLDFNLMVGNSLLDEFEGIKLFDEKLLENSDKIKLKLTQSNLFEAPQSMGETFLKERKFLLKEFFNPLNSYKKSEIKEEIENKEWELIKYTLIENGNIDKWKNIEKYKKQNKKPYFLWKLEFADVFIEKGGFDIVIGNPPYIKEAENKEAFNGIRNNKEYYQGKMDIWYYFSCIGLDLLKDKGTLAIIAQNNWITSDGASKLRNKIIMECKIIEFIDFFDYKVFNTAGIQTMIKIIEKNNEENRKYNLKYARLLNDKISLIELMEFLNKKRRKDFEYFICSMEQEILIDKVISFVDVKENNVLEKIKSNSKIFLKNEEIFSGIDIMQDFLSKDGKEILGSNFNIGDGIFALSNIEKEEMNLNLDELELVKPLFTPKEINRYYSNANNNYWVIYTDSKFKDPNSLDNCQNIKKHLDKYQKIITSVNKPYGLHRARKEEIFLGEKIMVIRKSTETPRFSYVDFDSYCNRTFNIIKTERINYKYLLAILNSKITKFWLFYKGKMQGKNFQLDIAPLLSIPIKIGIKEIESKIISVVDKIHSLKKLVERTEELENELDELIYDLYELTEEEKEVVRNFGK